MDGSLGITSIKPDQMQIINPLLILILVPIFESLIYPCFSRCNLMTPLQRMATGGLLAALSFIISGVVEIQVEATSPRLLEAGTTQLNFVNTLPCPISFHYNSAAGDKGEMQLEAASERFLRDLHVNPYELQAEIILSADGTCGGLSVANARWNGQVNGLSKKAFLLFITLRDGKLLFEKLDHALPTEKSSSGEPRLG